jgi:hypothetical protein
MIQYNLAIREGGSGGERCLGLRRGSERLFIALAAACLDHMTVSRQVATSLKNVSCYCPHSLKQVPAVLAFFVQRSQWNTAGLDTLRDPKVVETHVVCSFLAIEDV